MRIALLTVQRQQGLKNPNPTREMERRTLRPLSYTGRSIPEMANVTR